MSLEQAEPQYPRELHDEGISVSLTDEPLDISTIITSVKSPKAGAIVLFAGTFPLPPPPTPQLTSHPGITRDNSSGKRVKSLRYETYPARALKTMLTISQRVKFQHSLTSIGLVHRIGYVPIGDESILIAVSAPHRQEAWAAGEQALEECKANTEIWKEEELYKEDGTVETVWADGAQIRGKPVSGV